MFRLFIEKKLQAAVSKKEKGSGKPRRNRRIYERYPVDYKHLTMLNDQDILSIRDISLKGFSTYVSERSYERFEVGDVYAARMRYLGEIYTIEAKVSWKAKKDVIGFELVNAEKRTLEFMDRLLHPIEIAGSLRRVDATFMAQNSENKLWYHGDKDTDLYIWQSGSGELSAWRLVTKDSYVEWNQANGISTGKLSKEEEELSSVLNFPLQNSRFIADTNIDKRSMQLAIDVFMAVNIPEKNTLMETLTES